MQQSFETKLGREHHEMIWYGICCVVSLYCFFFSQIESHLECVY